ncbi:hypothetical protein ACWCRC_40905, partial [Streptomyces sp. NPDC001940]
LIACDLFEVRTLAGARLYVFAVIEHAEVCLVGTKDPAVVSVLPHGEGPVIVDLIRLPDAAVRRAEPGYVGLAW